MSHEEAQRPSNGRPDRLIDAVDRGMYYYRDGGQFGMSLRSGSTWGEIAMPSHFPIKKYKPVRSKVRYMASWRKEAIERKIRSL